MDIKMTQVVSHCGADITSGMVGEPGLDIREGCSRDRQVEWFQKPTDGEDIRSSRVRGPRVESHLSQKCGNPAFR